MLDDITIENKQDNSDELNNIINNIFNKLFNIDMNEQNNLDLNKLEQNKNYKIIKRNLIKYNE